MLDRLGRTLELGVSDAELTLVLTEGRGPFGMGGVARKTVLSRQVFVPGALADISTLAPALVHALAESPHQGLSLRIVLADSWFRLFMTTPPHNATRVGDCESASLMRFELLYGGAANLWHFSADMDARNPFLSCAMHVSLLELLQEVSASRNLVLLSIKPFFVACWNHWQSLVERSKKTGAHHTWFGVSLGEELSLALVNKGRLTTFRSNAFIANDLTDHALLSSRLQREALRACCEVPLAISLFGDAVQPAAATDRQDLDIYWHSFAGKVAQFPEAKASLLLALGARA